MGLKVLTDIPYGNARAVSVIKDADKPEILFAANPRGACESLWFAFRIVETAPDTSHPAKLKLTLKHCDTLAGATTPSALLPVYRPSGQGWHRASGGVGGAEPDGRTHVSWTLPYPAPKLDVALCYPYGREETRSLLAKSKGYWKLDEIGMTQAGHPFERLANDYGSRDGRRHGLYLLARQCPGETPGSWTLDGTLQFLSRVRRDPYLVWCAPFADMDGIARGQHRGGGVSPGVDRSWSTPPGRHECLVLQADIARWKERCRPELALEFRASEACETDGIYCELPSADAAPDAHKDAAKWANVVAQALGPDLAAADFKRRGTETSGSDTFMEYACGTLGVCALTVRVPYAKVGTTVLAQKQYRDAGERIAKALVRRFGG